ncbi:hypothetical protein [Pedobacter cryophilus]|uniref:Uncharacterized protein n=1 Tax=Pedobacter cryophilus TaxID=2571271 RepID=A0A4U1C5U1_9SPHI|nr:hypothetical protein [Pedobacter cryophilus]TKC00803.1 hypothetical protein FA046_03765 [Pedobacter cryophilus]
MKATPEGIYFENSDLKLKWDDKIESFTSENNLVVEKSRIGFYSYLGEDTLIKDSEINLRTFFINSASTFKELEYSVSSRTKAIKDFDILKEYFTKSFGPPIQDNQNEIVWNDKFLKIKLDLEDFHGLNLNLIITKITPANNKFVL